PETLSLREVSGSCWECRKEARPCHLLKSSYKLRCTRRRCRRAGSHSARKSAFQQRPGFCGKTNTVKPRPIRLASSSFLLSRPKKRKRTSNRLHSYYHPNRLPKQCTPKVSSPPARYSSKVNANFTPFGNCYASAVLQIGRA